MATDTVIISGPLEEQSIRMLKEKGPLACVNLREGDIILAALQLPDLDVRARKECLRKRTEATVRYTNLPRAKRDLRDAIVL